jgi:hypothetical protein
MSFGSSSLSGVSLIKPLNSAIQPSSIVFCGNVGNHVFMQHKKEEGFDSQSSLWVYLGFLQRVLESVM